MSNTISIHPPREGWDAPYLSISKCRNIFQSTHPVRGGTNGLTKPAPTSIISIHPPREGWDLRIDVFDREGVKFQSTHPVRGGT